MDENKVFISNIYDNHDYLSNEDCENGFELYYYKYGDIEGITKSFKSEKMLEMALMNNDAIPQLPMVNYSEEEHYSDIFDFNHSENFDEPIKIDDFEENLNQALENLKSDAIIQLQNLKDEISSEICINGDVDFNFSLDIDYMIPPISNDVSESDYDKQLSYMIDEGRDEYDFSISDSDNKNNESDSESKAKEILQTLENQGISLELLLKIRESQ